MYGHGHRLLPMADYALINLRDRGDRCMVMDIVCYPWLIML